MHVFDRLVLYKEQGSSKLWMPEYSAYVRDSTALSHFKALTSNSKTNMNKMRLSVVPWVSSAKKKNQTNKKHALC